MQVKMAQQWHYYYEVNNCILLNLRPALLKRIHARYYELCLTPMVGEVTSPRLQSIFAILINKCVVKLPSKYLFIPIDLSYFQSWSDMLLCAACNGYCRDS